MQTYTTSVVEKEVFEGIINTEYVTKYTALAFLRRIDDINMSDTRGGMLVYNSLIWRSWFCYFEILPLCFGLL